jgi:hypothetical protein
MTTGSTAGNKLALLVMAGAVIAMGVASAANAQSGPQYDGRGRPVYNNGGPNAVYQQGRTRIYVSRRSWLDGGTEVLPGDRKFQDYAFPPAVGFPTFARENNNRPIDRQPLNPPSDLGGEPTRVPLY